MAIEVIKCPACGGQIQVESNNEFGFCSFCGNKIRLRDIFEVKQTITGVSSAESRSNALDEIEEIVRYFDMTKPLYVERRKYKEKLEITSGYGFQIFIMCVGLGLAGYGIYELIDGYGHEILNVFLLAAGVIAILGGFAGILMDKNKALEIKESIKKIDEKILKHYLEYENCPLGFEYTNPKTLHIIYDYIRQGRAYSIKEALNMYLQEK